MKKNLRSILVLALGLMTTVTFAQDWGVDSRTRVNMHGENDMMLTEQRATVGATWGGDSWGIHVSSEINYALGGWDLGGTDPGTLTAKVYEAYASTDLMGYANMSMGRMAWDFGSGAVLGSNQFGSGTRNTNDGFLFDVTNDMLDLSVGISKINFGFAPDSATGASNETSGSYTVVNAGKADGDWSVNLLWTKASATVLGEDAEDVTSTGIDLGYAMMGGALELSASMNSMSDGDTLGDGKMTSYGLTYNVNDNLSVSANQTTYGERAFSSAVSNMGNGANSWLTHGNIGYLGNEDKDLSFGVNYDMGGISLGVTMHNISNGIELEADPLTGEMPDEYERSATEFSLGYNINDNASLSLSRITDDHGTDEDTDYMWLTITVTP